MSIIGEPVKFKSPNFVFIGEIYRYAFVAATAVAAAVNSVVVAASATATAVAAVRLTLNEVSLVN